MPAYYNEFDPYAAQWLRNLIAAGHIAPGDVDNRSILDVSPDDLNGYTQCHFFAGIGVWSHALRLAGWPDDRPVWTGSCPCQPFSVAGLGAGFDDERHLWPFWFHLIEQRHPPVVFGEQVEAAIRHGWLDLVQSDLEGIGYAFEAAGLPAAGVGAPHIRQRLWFVADATERGWHQGRAESAPHVPHADRAPVLLADDESQRFGEAGQRGGRQAQRLSVGCAPCGLGDDDDEGLEGLGIGPQAESGRVGAVRPVATAGESGGVEFPVHVGRLGREATASRHDDDRTAPERAQGEYGSGLAGAHRIHQHGAGPDHSHWREADWLFCRDGKWRPVESGTFPLAHGAPARVGRLRAYGNAIVPQVAAEVIKAYMECRP